ERNRRRLSLRVRNAHLTRFDPADQIRAVAELEDVARHTLDSEILIEGADERVRRLENHSIVAEVGNRPARRTSREARPAPAAQSPVHSIVVHIRASATAPRRKTIRQHLYHRVEILPLELAVWIGATDEREERVLLPLLCGGRGNDLLRKDVEWT